jgi:hypothetical protein
MAHIDFMKEKAQEFIQKINNLGIETGGFSVSENLYGVSVYFDGKDKFGRVFNFRFSDHDCQRGSGSIEKVSPSVIDAWCLDYEKFVYPERFEWEYFDKWVINSSGERKQVKRFIGRK